MKIYLTRHGQTQWNEEGRMQGWKNSDLTLDGIEKAKKLGASLNDTSLTILRVEDSKIEIELEADISHL